MTEGTRDYRKLLDESSIRGGPRLKVGDIVMSPNFPYCHRGSGGVLHYSSTVLMCLWNPLYTQTNLDQVDYSRETARWVVIEIEESEGSWARAAWSSAEWYPGSIQVTVQRLGKAEELLPEKISFSPFNSASGDYLPNVGIVGKLKVVTCPACGKPDAVLLSRS